MQAELHLCAPGVCSRQGATFPRSETGTFETEADVHLTNDRELEKCIHCRNFSWETCFFSADSGSLGEVGFSFQRDSFSQTPCVPQGSHTCFSGMATASPRVGHACDTSGLWGKREAVYKGAAARRVRLLAETEKSQSPGTFPVHLRSQRGLCFYRQKYDFTVII